MCLISVSKPDAENPIVKKAKIPKPELKIGSEDYQKNASSLNLIGEFSIRFETFEAGKSEVVLRNKRHLTIEFSNEQQSINQHFI